MSGTTDRERQPETDAEWARDTDRRLDEAEQPESTRCGDWTISTEDGTGNLIACHVDGGCIRLGEKPPADADPDGLHETPPEQIPEQKCPRIKVKGGIKTIGNNSLTLYDQWNTGFGTGDFEEPIGTWTWTGSTFTIPEEGDYTIKLFMPWANNVAGTERSIEIRRNGVIVDLDNRAPANGYAYCRVATDYRCALGDTFEVRVYQNSGANLNCGGPNFGDAWAQLSIVKIAESDIIAHDAGTL